MKGIIIFIGLILILTSCIEKQGDPEINKYEIIISGNKYIVEADEIRIPPIWNGYYFYKGGKEVFHYAIINKLYYDVIVRQIEGDK